MRRTCRFVTQCPPLLFLVGKWWRKATCAADKLSYLSNMMGHISGTAFNGSDLTKS
jgi:hypothetical protein